MKHFFGRCALPMLFLAPACVTEFPGGAPSPTGASPAPEAGPPGAAPSPPATPPAPVPAASRAPAAPARLGLARAIITALERNPQLAVARKSEGVSEAALEVSRAYPYNPMLQTDLRPYSREEGGETGEFFVEAALLQEIELAGQGRYRRRTGAAELTRAQWEIRALEVQVIAETGRRFFDALYWRERRELDESLARLRGDLLGITERRFQAGLSTSSEVTLAKIESRSAEDQLELTRLRQDAALAELRKHLGLTADEPLEPEGSLGGFGWTPPADLDVASLVESRPDVNAAGAERDAAGARADLASAERVPNLSVGPVYERDEAGTDFFGLKLELPIPVLSTGGPLVRQRRAELDERVESLKQLRQKARAEIETAAARYQRAFRLAARFRGDLQENLEREVERVMDQYEAGLATLPEAYGSRDKMMQSRANGLDALHELALSAADLTQAAALAPGVLFKPAVSTGTKDR